MNDFRQRVIDATLAVLGDSAGGFNAQHAAIASDYGVEPCEIQWGFPSPNLMIGAIDPDMIDRLRIESWPALVLSTEDAIDEGRPKFADFAGQVILSIDAYIRFRAVDDRDGDPGLIDMSGNYERQVNCFENAVYRALREGKKTYSEAGCGWTGYESSRSQITVFGDGWTQQARMLLWFRVVVKF